MNRNEMLARVDGHDGPWDMIVIGGGATGVGIAVDAASRGYDVVLLEGADFGKGTSSRSTKLVHGGVRYLQQGNISLVMEALKERGILRQNAPHLVSDLRFIVPNYVWWEAPFYGIGMKVYDMLAGRYGFGPSRVLSEEATLEAIPTLKTEGLRGGVQYYDGQFDDARLLINLVQTAAEQGAALLNYASVTTLHRDDDGYTEGVTVVDHESDVTRRLAGRVVVNATGAFADTVRRLDEPDARPMISPSRGVHIVLDAGFLPGDSAIMVPHTPDGRIMFAIPWHGHAVVGTTDTPVDAAELEPRPGEDEIDMILDTAGSYLTRPPTRDDIQSVFAGIRPLVSSADEGDTAHISREHTIAISGSGLVTIAGGKWTTYRRMAEECVDQAAMLARLEERPCTTHQLNIHGFHEHAEKFDRLAFYGADAPAIEDLVRADAALGTPLHPDLPICGAEIAWAAREEMARTVDDALARRTRALFLDANAAIAMAPEAARILATELDHDDAWAREQVEAFTAIADGYRVS